MSAVLLVAIPLLVAFFSILVKKISPYLLLFVSFGLVVMIGYLDYGIITIGGFASPYGISLVVDSFSVTALYVVNVLFFLVVVISIFNYKKLSSILLVSLAGLNGLMLTGDLFNLFVFLEISAISAYLITTTNKKPLATFNYLVAGTVGSSLYLLGLIILYGMFGTLNMSDLGFKIAISGATNMDVALPFLLMFIGLGVEAKLLPFNSWVKGILGNSNKLTGPMIAGVYASASLFVFGRLLTEVFVISDQLMLIIAGIITISIVAGEAMAYSSNKAREILLFSSVAQAGIAVLVFVYGFTGYAMLFVALNGFSKLVLFLIINHATEAVGSDDVDALEGLFVNNKLVGVAFSVVVLSLLGLPLFAGFGVKMGILSELFSAGSYFFPAVILLSSVVEGVYFIKLLIKLWYKDSDLPVVKFEIALVYTVVVIALLFVVYGVYFEPLQDHFNILVMVLKGGLL